MRAFVFPGQGAQAVGMGRALADAHPAARAVFAEVDWLAALPLAIGLFAGGRLGPRVVRRVRGTLLRRVIAVAGLALAAQLAWQAFR